ncbi:unnamed protein product [Closterium sp. Yama58-4]|nr:unnamed protein product [Closterium sp. Yama58-4]
MELIPGLPLMEKIVTLNCGGRIAVWRRAHQRLSRFRLTLVAWHLVERPRAAGVLLADPGAAGVLLADPGAAGVLLADPGAAGVLLADPGAAGVLLAAELHLALLRWTGATLCTCLCVPFPSFSAIMGSSLQIGSSLKDAPSRGEEEPAENGSIDSGGRQQLEGEKKVVTSSNETARRQGGGTSAEVCVLWHLSKGERGGMTHGRQPLACGCLLLALLTTRSRQGGHVGQGGKHATLGDRGKKDTWGMVEEATRRHFRVAVGRVEAERVVPLSLVSPPHGWPRSSLLLVFFLQHRPPCTFSSSFDAQPDLHSVLIPFPPSRRAHGESTASHSARGEVEEREGVVDGLDEWMHGGGCCGKWNGE